MPIDLTRLDPSHKAPACGPGRRCMLVLSTLGTNACPPEPELLLSLAPLLRRLQ